MIMSEKLVLGLASPNVTPKYYSTIDPPFFTVSFMLYCYVIIILLCYYYIVLIRDVGFIGFFLKTGLFFFGEE